MQETQTVIKKRTITPVISFTVQFYDYGGREVSVELWESTIPDMLYEAYSMVTRREGAGVAGCNVRSEYGTIAVQIGKVLTVGHP